MKELNSVVLEGAVCSCIIHENCVEIIIQNNEKGFKAVGYGKVGDYISQHYKYYRGVRIVGKLDIGRDGMFVLIEHVEFKPIGA